MSETSSRYQNALRYAPGRSVGVYPDAWDITQLPTRNVSARTPIQYVPRLSTVATTDPVLLGQPPEVVFGDIPMDQAPVVPVADAGSAPSQNMLGLIARYGPRVANELFKRLRQDELPALDGRAWADSLPADHIAYTGFGFDPLPAETGIFMPSFADGVAPVGAGDVVDAMNLTRGGLGFGGDAGADAASGTLDKVGAADPGGGLGSGVVGGIRDALGTAGAAGTMSGQLTGAFGDLSDVAGGAISAVGGWMGNNLAHAAYQNNGSPQNVDIGSAVGAAIGSVIIPYVGAFPGAAIGGMIGGSINPQPDYKQAFANFSVNPQGGFDAVGIQRNNAGQDVADNLAQQASMYWSDLAAQRGYTPNAAMMNQGFRFGVGQGDNMLGGWFLQPYAGDANLSDVRPDMHMLTVEDPVRRAQVAAEVAAQYRPGGNAIIAGPDMAGQRGDEFTRAPASLQEALDLGFDRLVGLGYYTAAGGPSPQDVAANIAQQQAWAAANPQMMWSDGESPGWMEVPWANTATYQPGWAPPTQVANATQPYVESNG